MRAIWERWAGPALHLYILTVLAAFCAAAAPPSQPVTTEPTTLPAISIVRTHTTPVIDGNLDDRVWKTAAIINRFTQVDPEEGAAPSENTEVRLLYDRDNLYVAVRCFDSDPSQIIGK